MIRRVVPAVVMMLLLALACRGEAQNRADYKETHEGLEIDLDWAGLKKDAPYVLTLNGKVGQDGNECLRRYKDWGGEGYYDLPEVNSDARGRLTYKRSVKLPKGKYHVTFLLKDVEDKHKVVMFRNNWRFEVKEGDPCR